MYTAPRGPVGIAMLVLLAIMVLTVFLYESCEEDRAAVVGPRSMSATAQAQGPMALTSVVFTTKP